MVGCIYVQWDYGVEKDKSGGSANAIMFHLLGVSKHVIRYFDLIASEFFSPRLRYKCSLHVQIHANLNMLIPYTPHPGMPPWQTSPSRQDINIPMSSNPKLQCQCGALPVSGQLQTESSSSGDRRSKAAQAFQALIKCTNKLHRSTSNSLAPLVAAFPVCATHSTSTRFIPGTNFTSYRNLVVSLPSCAGSVVACTRCPFTTTNILNGRGEGVAAELELDAVAEADAPRPDARMGSKCK